MKKNNKGFTLMEMLIVVAIIAVLIAIAIPTFNKTLEKSRESTDAANIRAAYAKGMSEVLTGTDLDAKNGVKVWTEKMVQAKEGWINEEIAKTVIGEYAAGGDAKIGDVKPEKAKLPYVYINLDLDGAIKSFTAVKAADAEK